MKGLAVSAPKAAADFLKLLGSQFEPEEIPEAEVGDQKVVGVIEKHAVRERNRW